jgi:hypothetical protein
MGGYIGFCAKACVGGALALVVALMPMTAQAPATRTAPEKAHSQPASSLYTSTRAASLATTARTLEPYLVRQANGTLTLNAPANVLNGLPAGDVQALGTGLNALNTTIASGALRTNRAGAVFDPNTDRLTLQAGWTGFGQDWWHGYYCLSHEDLQKMTRYGVAGLTSVAIVVIARLAKLLGFAIAVVVGLYTSWMDLADNGRGSCLNLGHWPPPNAWVTSQ